MTAPIPQNPTKSALFMLSASVLVAGTTIIAKALGTDTDAGVGLHPFQVSAGRFLFALLGLSTVLVVLRPKFKAPNLKLHFVRSIFGWAGVSLMFAAVAMIPISDATAISFLNPVFGMVLAIPILGERVGPIRWAAAAIAFTGALILLRPGTSAFEPAALLALIAALLFGFEVIIIKKLSGTEPVLQILTLNNCIGTVIAVTVASFVWIWPTNQQWILLACLGLMMVCAQTLYVQSLRNADASFALPFSYAILVFATLYDFWIFHVKPDSISILGAVIILGGALMLVLREAYLNRRKL